MTVFKITPIQEKSMQKSICEACGAVYREDAFAYLMLDVESGDTMAVSQFEISGSEGKIFDIRPAKGIDDDEAMFILTRQTMNFIDTCGAHICRAAPDCADESFLLAVGFKKDNNGYSADMTGMFSGNCHGCQK